MLVKHMLRNANISKFKESIIIHMCQNVLAFTTN